MNSNSNQALNILRVKDKNEKHYTTKFPLSDIPFRILVVGKSQLSGKTTFLVNLLLNPDGRFYTGDFKGENIFLISGSVGNDRKLKTLIDEKDIENVFHDYDEDTIEAIYQMIQEEYEEAVSKNKKPENYLMIFDDMSFKGIFKGKDFSIIKRIFSNGRHINLSCIVTAQKYTDISTSIRENMTLGVFFNCSDKQLDVITEDINYSATKKEFKQKFRHCTREKHSFFVVNFTNDPNSMYMDCHFQPISFEQENQNVPRLKSDKSSPSSSSSTAGTELRDSSISLKE
jgi:hypothetical protein